MAYKVFEPAKAGSFYFCGIWKLNPVQVERLRARGWRVKLHEEG